MLDLSIIIVNYDVKDRLRECLHSICRNTRKVSFQITVIDNNSSDSSCEMIRREFSEVKLIENSENFGFAKGVNQGLKDSEGKYLLLLNPDTIVLPNALDKMVEFMEGNPQAGALGCRLLNPAGNLQPSCRSFPNLRTAFFEASGLERLFSKNKVIGRYRMGYWKHDCVREVDQPMGSVLLLRRDVINQVGLMDERFHMYYEEVDLCYRIKKTGWKIYFTPDAEVIHYAGESARQNLGNVLIEQYRSMHKFYRKHFGLFPEILVRAMNFCGLLLRISVGSLSLVGRFLSKNRIERYWQYRRNVLKERCRALIRDWRLWV